jgi:hypothetical protein
VPLLSDLCRQALSEASAFSQGQSPSAGDLADTLIRLQDMMMEWSNTQAMVFRSATQGVVSTGASSYSVGPGQTFPVLSRPARLLGGFVRKTMDGNGPGDATTLVPPIGDPQNVDFPLQLCTSAQEFNSIRLKNLSSIPEWLWYDNNWPTGALYTWPVLPASQWSLFITYADQLHLDGTFLLTDSYSFPPEYKNAIVLNLALAMRRKFRIPTYPGDALPLDAKRAKKAVMTANFRSTKMSLPADVLGGPGSGSYNIFSDES